MWEYEPPATDARSGDEQEESLKFLEELKERLYQFTQLYDNWSEDRIIAAQRGEAVSKLIEVFSAQLNHFETLENHVRNALVHSIRESTVQLSKAIAEETSQITTKEIQKTVDQLQKAVSDAHRTLIAYQGEVIMTQWKVIGGVILTTILSVFLVVKFVIAPSYIASTEETFSIYEHGLAFDKVWPKLNKKEQEHFLILLREDMSIEKSKVSVASKKKS